MIVIDLSLLFFVIFGFWVLLVGWWVVGWWRGGGVSMRGGRVLLRLLICL